MILLGFQTLYLHNSGSSSHIQFIRENNFNFETFSFVPCKRNKTESKGQRLRNRLIRLKKQAQFLSLFLTWVLPSDLEMIFLQMEILFAAFGFHVFQHLQRPNLPKLSLMFHFSSYSNVTYETTSIFLQTGCQSTFFLECYYKTEIWVGSLHWKPSLLQFSSTMCCIVFFWISSLVSKICFSVSSLKVSTNKVSVVTSRLKNNLSASAFQSNQ